MYHVIPTEKMAYILTIGTKFQDFCQSLNAPDVDGYKKMNNMLSSTCQVTSSLFLVFLDL
jgi:hypothetical protein